MTRLSVDTHSSDGRSVMRSMVSRSGIAAFTAMLTLPAVGGMTRQPPSLPFGPGERITYHVYAKGMGSIGRATMSVEGPVDVRGTPTLLLRSQTVAGVGPFRGSQLSESWLDPIAMRSLRFHERERRFLSTHNLNVEIYPDDEVWTSADGTSGASLTTASLDELSFIYFLRSLPVGPDTTYQFNRHFDAARNPITVRMAHGDVVSTDLGDFTTVLMEMRVHDPRRYRGDGVIRVYLSDDKCRIPVRIESSVPRVGSFTLTLESYADPAPVCNMAERPHGETARRPADR